MKKMFVLLFSLVFLVACGNIDEAQKNNQKESKTSETIAAKVAVEENKPGVTFEDGTLETEEFTLKVSKTEVIQSPSEDKFGLFITFKLTNKTKDKDIVPTDTLMNLLVQQENETSRVDLSENYYFLDAFGSEDDVATYNKMVDLENASSNALLPGKTVEFVEAYGLDNDTHDVNFIGIDQATFEQIREYTVKLK